MLHFLPIFGNVVDKRDKNLEIYHSLPCVVTVVLAKPLCLSFSECYTVLFYGNECNCCVQYKTKTSPVKMLVNENLFAFGKMHVILFISIYELQL